MLLKPKLRALNNLASTSSPKGFKRLERPKVMDICTVHIE